MIAPKRAAWIAAFALSGMLAVSGCAAVGATTTDTDDTTVVETAPHWSYDTEDGPTQWANISDDYGVCSAGTQQSPIDLPSTLPEPSATFAVGPDSTEGEAADNGHTVQFTVDDDASAIRFDEDEYTLVQAHFHTPSEHTIDGVPAAAEFHLVHADAEGDLLVLGVLVQEGAASSAWQPFVDAAAEASADHGDAHDTDLELDLTTLLPADLSAYGYSGSLTTPPCSEGVQWLVLQTPLTFSAEQIAALHDVHEDNARPVQPLGDRVIVGVTGTLD